jgi:WD40 repeat protein
MTVTPDGRSFILGCSDDTLKLWHFDAPNQVVQHFVGHKGTVFSVAISTDGSRTYSGSYDATIRVWNTCTSEQLAVLESHTKAVRSLALTGNLLISGGSFDASAKMWNTANNELMLSFLGHTNSVSAVAITADISRVVTGSWDKSVRVWDTSGSQQAQLDGHTDSVTSVAVSRDGLLAASGSDDKSIRVWNLVACDLRLVLQVGTVSAILFM